MIITIFISFYLILTPSETTVVSPITNPLAEQTRSGTSTLLNFQGNFVFNLAYSRAYPGSPTLTCFTGISSLFEYQISSGLTYGFINAISCQSTYVRLRIYSNGYVIAKLKGNYLAIDTNSVNTPSLTIFKHYFCCYFPISSSLSHTDSLGSSYPIAISGGWSIAYFLFQLDISNTTALDNSFKISGTTNGTHLISLTVSSYSSIRTQIISLYYTVAFFGHTATEING